MSNALLKELPALESEGLISAEQAARIRARYADNGQSASRMLVVFAILGSLLVGLGVILIIAHNWDDLPRVARTVIAFIPVLLGQGLVMFHLVRQKGSAGWREGSAVFLACALCACVALISQIYHVSGDLPGYLLTCSLLMLPLLYLPGSFITALVYLAMITWYAWMTHFEQWSSLQKPWIVLPLLLAAVPFYLLRVRESGTGAGFWWLSLFMALASGVSSQLFFSDLEVEQALSMMAVASVFTLVPWLHPGRELRTWPWVLVGALAILVLLFVFSFRAPWEDINDHQLRGDMIGAGALILVCAVLYVLSLRRRKPFERWPWPEALGLMLVCYGIGHYSPGLAALLVNAALLVMGVVNVRRGTEGDSLSRMNLGLAIIGLTILMRFFDTDLDFVVRGLGFIAIGAGFLYMNVRAVRQRKKHAQ